MKLAKNAILQGGGANSGIIAKLRRIAFAAAVMAIAFPSAVYAAQLGSTYTGDIPGPAGTPVLMFSGVTLDDVKSVSAMFTRTQMDTEANTPTYTSEYIPTKSDEDVVTNLVVRFQSYLGEYTKCVELELSQNDADIYGRVVDRYYSAKYAYRIGDSVSGWSENKNQGYMICNVAIFDETDDNLRTTLWWNGGASGTWDSTTENWLDASGAATAWVEGARACFTNDAAATVAIDAGGVSVSCILAYGHPVTFTGGTLTMVGSSELVMRTGLARFECPIAGDGGFRVVNRLYKNLLADTELMSATEKLLFENVALEGISSIYASPAGSFINVNSSTEARSYYLANNGTKLTTQMQFYDVGTKEEWTKCIMIELNRKNNGIYVKRTAGYYDNAHKFIDVRGRDFSVATDRSASYPENQYNISALRIGARVELAGANTFTGPLHAEGATTIALDGGTLSGGNFAGVVSLPNSTLEIAHTRQKFSGDVIRQSVGGTVDYTCSLVVKGTIDPSKNGTRTYSGALSGKANNVEQIIFPGVDVNEMSGWVGVEAYFTDHSMGNAAGGKAETYFFWNDGMTAKAQFKIADDTNSTYPAGGNPGNGYRPYVKATIYEFSHNGSDIVAKRLSSCFNGTYNDYKTNPVDFMGTDLYGLNVANAVYRCKDLTVVVSNVSDTVVTLAGTANTFGKGYITVDGAVLGLASASVAPPAYYNTVNVDTVKVKNGGKLFYTGTSDFLDRARATVDGGGRLAFCRSASLVTTASLVAKNGSEIVIEGGSITNTAVRILETKYNWCSFITLNGGTTISGGPFAIGRSGTKLTVSDADGSGAARIAQPFYIRGSKSVFSFVVPDVSGDDGADLLLDGQIRDHFHTDGPRPLVKSGAGTLRLGSSNKRTPALYKDADQITQFGNPEAWTGVFTVSGGKLLCGVDEALEDMSGIVLSGGSLDVAGTTTGTGTLQMTEDGAITLGDGGEISFADSSEVEWTSGKTLAITGTGKVRFGDSPSALTATQLSAIKLNGKSVKLSSTGYLRLPGLTLMIK